MATQLEVVNLALMKVGASTIASLGDNVKQAAILSALWSPVYRAELRKRPWSFALKRTVLSTTSYTVTGSANSGGLIKLTVAAHPFSTGDSVRIANVAGTTEANGDWIVTKTGTNDFTLNGSTFAHAYTSGGTATAIPAFHFGNQYSLPTDFIRLVQLGDVYLVPSMVDYRNGDDSAWAIEAGLVLTDFVSPVNLRYVYDASDPTKWDALFVEAVASRLAYEACEALTQSNEKRRNMAQDYDDCIRSAYKVNAIEKPPQGLPDDSWMISRL